MTQSKNPWKDFASYGMDDARYFKGREKSIARFLRIVNGCNTSVLYANSGIGKTSFLCAGIEPNLIEEGYAPIHILFNDNEFSGDLDFEEIITSHIDDEIKKHNELLRDNNFRAPMNGSLELWMWHSCIDSQTTAYIRNQNSEIFAKSLWWKLHTNELRDTKGQHVKLLLVFDQFEEVFRKTKNKKEERLNSLFSTLEGLSSSFPPQAVITALDLMAADKGLFVDLKQQPNYKIIFSLRKEYLSDFDHWTNDRYSIAELLNNRMMLLPLSRKQAKSVIQDQPLNKDGSECYTTLNAVTNHILDSIDPKNKDEIEPFILSLLCYRLYERALRLGKKELSPNDLSDYSPKTIIREFYEQRMEQLIPNQSHRKIIEENLVDNEGKRCRIKSKNLNDIGFNGHYKKILEDAHLLRSDTYNDEDVVELVHDRVADAIIERRLEVQKKKKLLFARISSFIALIGLFFLTYYIQTFPVKQVYGMPYAIQQQFSKETTIKGEYINVHDLPNLESIELTGSYIKVRNCKNLQYISIEEGCKDLTIDIDDNPNLAPIRIPETVRELHLGGSGQIPNNITFRTGNYGRYLWKDGCLFDVEKDSIIYARYDAKINVSLPSSFKKQKYVYNAFTLSNESADSVITITGGDKNRKEITLSFPHDAEQVNLNKTDDGRQLYYLSNSPFQDFPNLHTVILPDSLEYIGDSVFSGCKKLEQIILPKSLKGIGNCAFSGCSSLKTINIPSTLKSIGNSAFNDCSSLKMLNLPDSISMYQNSIYGCTQLIYVNLPHKISVMDERTGIMFYGCPNLKIRLDSTYHNYSIEEDGTIVYNDDRGIQTIIINNVKKHTFNSRTYSKSIRFVSENGALYEKDIIIDSIRTHLINDPIHDIYFRRKYIKAGDKEVVNIPISGVGVSLRFLDRPSSSCKEIHFPYPQGQREILEDIPTELKHNITLFVPYRSMNYFLDSFDKDEWKAIKEEPLLPWMFTIAKYHLLSALSIIGDNSWNWPFIILFVIIIAAYITYSNRRKETGLKSNSRGVAYFLLIILIGVFAWYTFYWFIFLMAHRFWEIRTNTIITSVAGLISLAMAYVFVYVCIYSDGFSPKGIYSVTKRNFLHLFSGIEDILLASKRLTWKSVFMTAKTKFENSLNSIKVYFIKTRLHLNNFYVNTSYKFHRASLNKKGISIGAILLVGAIAWFVNFYDTHQSNDLQKLCKEIIVQDSIDENEIEDLRKKLIESISIPNCRMSYSNDAQIDMIGDSLFIIRDRDSTYFINFTNNTTGIVNTTGKKLNARNYFYSSDSLQYVYCHSNYDTLYVWSKDSLSEIPQKLEFDQGLTWFANDRFLCLNRSRLYDTKTWRMTKLGEKYYNLQNTPNSIMNYHYNSNMKKTTAFVCDLNGDIKQKDYRGEYRCTIGDEFLLFEEDSIWYLYRTTDTTLLDIIDTQAYNDYFTCGGNGVFPHVCRNDSTFILNVCDNRLIIDTIPTRYAYDQKGTSMKNDTLYVYDNLRRKYYNLGVCADYRNFISEGFLAVKKNEPDKQLTIYEVNDTLINLGEIPLTDRYYSFDVHDQYVEIENDLYRHIGDSLHHLAHEDGIFVNKWFYKSRYNNYYYLDDFEAGAQYQPENICSNISRGGWCFVSRVEGRILVNIKSTKLLIKESIFLDDEQKSSLYRIMDKCHTN